jgi:hypothetical protein
MIRAAQIEFEMVIEDDLEAYPNDYLFQHPDYRAEDEARLEAWRGDDWHFVGVRAKATIKLPCGSNPDCWIATEVLSPGLWGIESDSGDAYFQEVYREEREILSLMLDSLRTAHRATASTAMLR